LRGTDSDVFVPPPGRWLAHTLAIKRFLKRLHDGEETFRYGIVRLAKSDLRFSGSFFLGTLSRVVFLSFSDARFLDGLLGICNVEGGHALIKVFDLSIESESSEVFLLFSAELGVSSSIFSESSLGFFRVRRIIGDLSARAVLLAHNEGRGNVKGVIHRLDHRSNPLFSLLSFS